MTHNFAPIKGPTHPSTRPLGADDKVNLRGESDQRSNQCEWTEPCLIIFTVLQTVVEGYRCTRSGGSTAGFKNLPSSGVLACQLEMPRQPRTSGQCSYAGKCFSSINAKHVKS